MKTPDMLRLGPLSFLLALLILPRCVGALGLELALEGDTVIAKGLAPGGSAALFGVMREIAPDDFPVVRSVHEMLVDDDKDGAVRWQHTGPLPKLSVFVAVDYATGAATAATSAPFGLRPVSFRGEGPGSLPNGLTSLADRRSLGYVFLVRPGVGAWMVFAGDGAAPGVAEDEDGQADGGFEIAVDRMEPLGSSPVPPKLFLPTDVVGLIDPSSFELIAVRLSGLLKP